MGSVSTFNGVTPIQEMQSEYAGGPIDESGAGPDGPLKKSAVDRELVAGWSVTRSATGSRSMAEGGLLAELTRLVLESALEGELTAHLGYENTNASRTVQERPDGTPAKTVLSKAGPVQSRFPGIGPGRSSPRSCGSGSAGWARSRTSCSRSPPAG